MKRLKSRAKFVLIVACIACNCALSLGSVSAANGTLTFSHGNNYDYNACIASTSSTKVEDSMDFLGVIDITYGGDTGRHIVQYPDRYNVSSATMMVNADGKRGYSQFEYYVNDVNVHTSTAPFYFDFT